MLELLHFHLCRRVCKGGLFVNPLLNNATLTGQRVRACVRACACVRVCVCVCVFTLWQLMGRIIFMLAGRV